jgi:AcrR family transcriptional regulator
MAARDVFVDLGPDAPLDEIARRAGVGIATLYRRFPDRPSLWRAVAHDVLTRVGSEASLALAEEPDAFRALARYMHGALGARISAIMPALIGRISLERDEEIVRARQAAVEPVVRMIDQAQSEGTLRPDVVFGDIGLLLSRLSRPLPAAFPRALDDSVAHRQLDLALAGLRASPHAEPLSGRGLTLDDLRTLGPEPPTGRWAVPD